MVKSSSFRILLAVIACCAALTGCRNTAYYQDRAVTRAREYLLENAPELTPTQVAYVRYNKPTLLTENVFSRGFGGWGANSERSQICVTWLIPECENVYLVFGVSSIRMDDWYPNRVIRKVFPKPDRIRLAAVGTARNYATSNLFYDLSVKEYNLVRFADPKIVRTKFELSLDPDKKLTAEELAALQKQTQFALVWPLTGEGKSVVICGLGNADLGGFKVNFGGKLDDAELAANTLGDFVAGK